MEGFTFTGLVVYIFLFGAITLALWYMFKHLQMVRLIDKIPGPKTVPLLGNALELNVEPKEVFHVLCNKFCNYDSSISRIWLGFRPWCLLYKAKAVEAIMSSNKYIDKTYDYSFLSHWLGTGLLISTESAMGRSINAQDNSESDYVKAVSRIVAIIQHRQTRPWLHPDIIFKLSSISREHEKCLKILHGFTLETIKEKMKESLCDKAQESCKKAPENEIDNFGIKKKRLAFLDLLLEYSKNDTLSVEEIRGEVDTFMFAGHDTTAAAINWALYLLGWYPEIQKKVHDELDFIFGDSDRPVTSDDIREMKFLECCIKESLRIFPSVPIFGRALKEDAIVDGYKVPAGTSLAILTFRLHRDPEQFPDPESFKPERFMTDSSNRHPYAYVPFSAGPRNCIGQRFATLENKVVLANLLRKYRVESVVKREDLKIIGEIVLRPEDGNFVKFFQRKK